MDAADADMIADHVRDCEHVDGAGEPVPAGQPLWCVHFTHIIAAPDAETAAKRTHEQIHERMRERHGPAVSEYSVYPHPHGSNLADDAGTFEVGLTAEGSGQVNWSSEQ